MGLRFHGITPSLVQVLDKAQAERAAAVLVALELGDRSLGSLGRVEFDHAGTARPTARLILDLGALDLSNCGEKLHKVFIAS